MTSPNFSVRVWIAFDAPSSASPTWVEITGFVEMDNPITISPGRSDGLSDVNAATCSLVVDNSDGRFSSANPAGAWYGQIHKGNWLKVEIVPPSATTSSRFVGFITSLPTQWSGQYAFGLITASDRFEKLGQNPSIISMIESEVLTDPNLAGNVKSYWNLHEGQGSLSFGDTSGNGARALVAAGTGGIPAGIGFAASNADGPGFDGLRAVTFAPLSVSQGTYLTGPITCPVGTFSGSTYTGLLGTVEFWFQAVTTNVRQMLVALVDPIAQFALTMLIDSSGYLGFSLAGTTPTNTANYGSGTITVLPRVDDGKWHQLMLGIAATNAGTGTAIMSLVLDGATALPGGGGNSGSGVTSGNLTQIIVGAGYDGLLNNGLISCGASNIAEVAWLWADMPVTGTHTATAPPDAASHYAAATTGFLGESTDSRIARIARYAGVPIPTTTVSNPMGMGVATRYAGGTAPWTSLAAGAHLVGVQSMAGRKPLDVMQEAAHTEGMPLYVNRSGYLAIQASTARQNTSPAWSVNALDLDPSTQVADDFAYTTNQMTVTPNSQAAQTVIGGTGSAGRLSQAKYGIYDGSQATASVSPTEAQSLGLGIIQLRADPAPRLAPLALEASTTALLPGYGNAWYDAVLATNISTPVRLTNAPAVLGGGNVDVLIEGWTETITAGSHLFAFNVSPAQGPTYQLDDVVLGHIDTDGSTLASNLTTGGTAVQLSTTGATSGTPMWVMDSAQFPFDVRVDAEQITLSAYVPPTLGSGADPTFEAGLSGWSSTSVSQLWTTADFYQGSHSCLVSFGAGTGGTMFPLTAQAATAGIPYYVLCAFKLASGSATVRPGIQWQTGGGANLSVSNCPTTTATSTWQTVAGWFTSPATTGNAYPLLTFAGTAGSQVYVDFVVLQSSSAVQNFTGVRSVNGVVASHSTGAAVSLWQPLTLAY